MGYIGKFYWGQGFKGDTRSLDCSSFQVFKGPVDGLHAGEALQISCKSLTFATRPQKRRRSSKEDHPWRPSKGVARMHQDI